MGRTFLSNQNKVGCPAQAWLGRGFFFLPKINMWGRASTPVQAERKLGKKACAVKLRVTPDLNCDRAGQHRLASDGHASKITLVFGQTHVVVRLRLAALS
jgi:hypothetical protein